MIALIDAEKGCSKCKQSKPLSAFHNCRGAPFDKAYWCKECANANTRRHHSKEMADDPEKYHRKKKDSRVRSKYGLTLAEYEQKLFEQYSACKICRIPLLSKGQHTHLDHNHKTGKIRDFLCTNCNRGLGHFQDSWEILSSAMNYLERHGL